MSAERARNMRATTEAFLYAWNGEWTAETNRRSVAVRAPECEHIMLPASLEIPSRTNAEWSEYFKHLEGSITDAKMEILDYVANVEERRAVAHSTMTAMSRVGMFKNEYVWFLNFNETGDQITVIKEFLDSHATKELRAKLAEARK